MSENEHYHAVRNVRTFPTAENDWAGGEERVVLGDPKPTPELAQQVLDADERAYESWEGQEASWEVNGPCDCDPEGAAREAEENARRDAEANEPVHEGELVDPED